MPSLSPHLLPAISILLVLSMSLLALLPLSSVLLALERSPLEILVSAHAPLVLPSRHILMVVRPALALPPHQPQQPQALLQLKHSPLKLCLSTLIPHRLQVNLAQPKPQLKQPQLADALLILSSMVMSVFVRSDMDTLEVNVLPSASSSQFPLSLRLKTLDRQPAALELKLQLKDPALRQLLQDQALPQALSLLRPLPLKPQQSTETTLSLPIVPQTLMTTVLERVFVSLDITS